MHSVGLTDAHRVSGKGFAVEGPHLVLALAVNYLHVFAYGFLGRCEAQRLVGYSQHASAFLRVDSDIGGESRFQFQIGILCADHHLVGYHVVGCRGLQTDLLHRTLEGVVGISVDGEGNAVALLYSAYVSLVHVGYYLHVGQVFGDGEELRSVETGSHGLTFLHTLRDNGSIDRRGDGGVA